jgi:hypothetical protein
MALMRIESLSKINTTATPAAKSVKYAANNPTNVMDLDLAR